VLEVGCYIKVNMTSPIERYLMNPGLLAVMLTKEIAEINIKYGCKIIFFDVHLIRMLKAACFNKQ